MMVFWLVAWGIVIVNVAFAAHNGSETDNNDGQCACSTSGFATNYVAVEQKLRSELLSNEASTSFILGAYLMHMGRTVEAEYLFRSLLEDCPDDLYAEG